MTSSYHAGNHACLPTGNMSATQRSSVPTAAVGTDRTAGGDGYLARLAAPPACLAAVCSCVAPAVDSSPPELSRWARTNQWNSSSWPACPMSMSWVTGSGSSVESIALRWLSMTPA